MRSLEAFLMEAWWSCLHMNKASIEDPQGGTICLGCAAAAAARYMAQEAMLVKVVVNPHREDDTLRSPSDDRPLER